MKIRIALAASGALFSFGVFAQTTDASSLPAEFAGEAVFSGGGASPVKITISSAKGKEFQGTAFSNLCPYGVPMAGTYDGTVLNYKTEPGVGKCNDNERTLTRVGSSDRFEGTFINARGSNSTIAYVIPKK